MPDDPPTLRSRLRIRSTLAIFVLIYILSLIGYWWVSSSHTALPRFDPTPSDHLVVSIDIRDIDTAGEDLDIAVTLIAPESYIDKELGVLNTDIAVRLYPWVDLGELKFKKGETPGSIQATIEAHGDADNWPFDRYATLPVTANALVGSGDDRRVQPVELRFSGNIEGWNAYTKQSDSKPPGTILEVSRDRGNLAFDIGVCLVLISLPVMAMVVAVETVMDRREFLPPYGTWFAAMLFAVVPLRSLLPGAPPLGAWIDQAVVLWVLIALAAAMGLHIVAWYQKAKK